MGCSRALNVEERKTSTTSFRVSNDKHYIPLHLDLCFWSYQYNSIHLRLRLSVNNISLYVNQSINESNHSMLGHQYMSLVDTEPLEVKKKENSLNDGGAGQHD